jgi:hypothetical protein
MKKVLIVVALMAAHAAPALALTVEPIPGSLIFPHPPRTKLTKAPIGSVVPHEFRMDGRKFREIYRIDKDRSLKLIDRYVTGDD